MTEQVTGRRQGAVGEGPPQNGTPQPKGAKTFLAASAVAQLMALIRYSALARLLGPEQLGLAAILVVTATFFDQVTDTGSERFVIQDRDGDDPAAQKLVQLVLIGRGVLVAVTLVLCSGLIAALYGAPRGLATALVALACAPMIISFIHVDMRRAQRRFDFHIESVAVLAAESVGLAATLTAALLTHSFTAILYGLIARAVVMVLVSHLMASRPYRIGFSRELAPRLLRFSAPLILNGMLLFLGSQGDRVLVANRAGVSALGHYSAVLLLIYNPAAMIQRYMHSMYLPYIAQARDDPADRARLEGVLGGQTLLLALLMSAGFALVAPPAVLLFYGRRFAMAAYLIGLIGVLQTSRFMIVWPTTIALGYGRSSNVLAGNCLRLLAYPAAFLGMRFLGGLGGVIAGFICGELAALCGAQILLNRSLDQPTLHGFDRIGIFAAGSALIICWTLAASGRLDLGHWEAAALLILSVGFVLWLASRERLVISETIGLLRRLTPFGKRVIE